MLLTQFLNLPRARILRALLHKPDSHDPYELLKAGSLEYSWQETKRLVGTHSYLGSYKCAEEIESSLLFYIKNELFRQAGRFHLRSQYSIYIHQSFDHSLSVLMHMEDVLSLTKNYLVLFNLLSTINKMNFFMIYTLYCLYTGDFCGYFFKESPEI